MWFVERACTDRHQGFRRELCHRRDICENLLPQRDQYRTADHRVSGGRQKRSRQEMRLRLILTPASSRTRRRTLPYRGQAFLRLCRRLSTAKGWLIISIRNRINLLGNLFQIIQIAPGDFKTGVDICVFLRGERIDIVFRKFF